MLHNEHAQPEDMILFYNSRFDLYKHHIELMLIHTQTYVFFLFSFLY